MASAASNACCRSHADTSAAVALVIACAAGSHSAQSSRQSDKQDEAAAKRQQEGIDQLRALTSEVKAIREQQATAEKRAAKQETEQERVFGPQNASQWVLAFFAAVAAFIAAISLGAINKQAGETAKAASAAKLAADTADSQFKMAMTGLVGISGAFMSEAAWEDQRVGKSGYPLPRQPTAITVGYTLSNASAVPITMTGFEARYRVSGDPYEYIHQIQINEMLTPGKGHPFPLPITELNETQRKVIMEGRLIVSLHMTVSITDPLNRTTNHEFRRKLICGQGDRSQSLLWDGNPDS